MKRLGKRGTGIIEIWVLLFPLVFLNIFGDAFKFPMLNTFLILAAPFILSYSKFSVRLLHEQLFLAFVLSNILIVIFILIQGISYSSEIGQDMGFAITQTGFMVQLVVLFYLLQKKNNIKYFLIFSSAGIILFSILNILCILGFIDPLNTELRNNMDYVSSTNLGRILSGKGLFFYMTNGNYALLTVLGIVSTLILMHGYRENKIFFLVGAFSLGLILIAAMLVQSRGLLVVLLSFFLLLVSLYALSKRRILFLAFIVGPAALMLFMFYSSAVFEFLFSDRSGLSVRVNLNSVALEMISEKPILGWSMAGQEIIAKEAHGIPIHNYFLRYASGIGLLGLITLITPIFLLGSSLFRRGTKDFVPSVLFAGLAGQLIMLNFYPGASTKPLALMVSLSLACLIFLRDKRGLKISRFAMASK